MRNISWQFANVKNLLLTLPFLLVTVPAAASQPSPAVQQPKQPQLWLTTGFRSYHFTRTAGYNEQNTGLGFELRMDERQALAGGAYYNSVRETSHYLQYAWTPVELGGVRLGAAAGVIDGYPQLRKGKLSFALIPVASLDVRLFGLPTGVNLVYIPTIADEVDGALALQFKLRVW